MTDHIFPILYINMAGEMMYILDQRLKVTREFQADEESKAEKVVKDIILTVLGKSTLENIFKVRGIPPMKGLRHLFEKLAHTSRMRLNENSMDKLFDLMVMAMKYSTVKVTMAEQLLTVTINHLQGMLDILPGDAEVRGAVEHAFTMLVSLYRPMNLLSWHYIRCAILQYFEDIRIKISMLLRDNRQLQDGRFVFFNENVAVELAPEMDLAPIGTTHYFANGVRVAEKDERFEVLFKYQPFKAKASLLGGMIWNINSFQPDALNVPERSTNLGENWYKMAGSMKIDGGGGLAKHEPTFKAANEMAFLESIMSRYASTTDDLDAEIMGMSLFDDPTEEKNYVKESEEWYGRVYKVDATKNRKSLKSTIEEKTGGRATSADRTKKKSKGAGMLELMDEAAARPPTAKPGRRSESSDSAAAAKPKSRAGSRPKERAPSATKRASSAKKKPST